MNDSSIMPFGQHAGKQLKEIPESYWGWFILRVGRTHHNYKIHDYIKQKHGIQQTNTRTEELQASADKKDI